MAETYFQLVVREFTRLKSLADGAISQVSDEQFFACPAAGDNSIAVVVKHVAGNMLSRWTDFLTSDGEKPDRDRDAEFRLLAGDNRERLLRIWERGWATLFAAVEPLRDSDMQRTVTIRGENLTVLQAVNRQLTHYAYHVGQIVYVAKHYCGPTWRTLSIPPGHSAEFNRRPARYVAPVGQDARAMHEHSPRSSSGHARSKTQG
jgi:hypothetical protein